MKKVLPLETGQVPGSAKTSALVPTRPGWRAVAAFGYVIEVLTVQPWIAVPAVQDALLVHGRLTEAASRVHDTGERRRGNAGSTDRTPAIASRGAIDRDRAGGTCIRRDV